MTIKGCVTGEMLGQFKTHSGHDQPKVQHETLLAFAHGTGTCRAQGGRAARGFFSVLCMDSTDKRKFPDVLVVVSRYKETHVALTLHRHEQEHGLYMSL